MSIAALNHRNEGRKQLCSSMSQHIVVASATPGTAPPPPPLGPGVLVAAASIGMGGGGGCCSYGALVPALAPAPPKPAFATVSAAAAAAASAAAAAAAAAAVAAFTPPASPVAAACASEQDQLLVINAQTLVSPFYGRVPHIIPPLCPVNAMHEKPIGYGAFGVVWTVVDPRDGRKLALKKIPNVFHNVIAAKRAFRELNFLYHVRHDNVVSIVSVLEEPNFPYEIYLLCDLMQTDLHRIIVSPQPLSADHVKIFLYQLLRGLKFLHSANILHRDIKPGNLLVNSDCKLKICDFGLARVDDPNSEAARSLTLEVVTQYYRAPELLMGALEYSAAIDIWSAGCIFAELLSRSILFQASNPLSQLDLIMDLLGTPDASDLASACTAARRYIMRLPRRRPKLATTLWSMSQTVTEDALHLLEHLLKFNPKQRATAASALLHPFLEDARLRYHSCMCSCCRPVDRHQQQAPQRHPRLHQHLQHHGYPHNGVDPEPICLTPMSDHEEAAIADVHTAKLKLGELVLQINQLDPRNRSMPLLLNRQAVNFRGFLKSSVAQPSEMPPSPHRWDAH